MRFLTSFIKFAKIILHSNIMKIKQKLEIIKRLTGLTQTKLAEKLGVSFVAFNSWWNEKTQPRVKMQVVIEELFLELTGQKIITADVLKDKKFFLKHKALEHKNIIKEILNNPDIRDQFILKLTYHSNSIEGSTLTESDTAAIMFDDIALANKSITEHLEVKNHQTALNYLFDYILNKGVINEALALKLHGILMNGIRPDAGVYRYHAVRIVGVNLPTANYLKIPDLIPEVMLEAAKKTNDVIAISALTHSHFEQIHPFSDGNGRVGRLLITALMLKNGLAPAIIRQEQKQLYYTYLYKAQSKGDYSQLENFLCEAVLSGFQILERDDLK